MDDIKQRLRAKPARQRRPHSLVRKSSIRLINLDRLPAPSSRGSIGKKLRMAALLQTHEPKDRLFNALAHGEEAVVLKKSSFPVTQRRSDIRAFFLGKNDAVELFVYHVVLFATVLITNSARDT